MINTYMKDRESAPVWAVLGAPLLGIPLLIGLLALAHPPTEAMEPDIGSMVTIEQIEDMEQIDDIGKVDDTGELDEHGEGTPASCDPWAPAVAVRNG